MTDGPGGYQEIADQAAADALLERCAGFHDALVKELHFVSRAFVDDERNAVLQSGRDLRVLVQTQWPPVALELLCLCLAELVIEQDPSGLNDTEWDGTIDVRAAEGPDDRPTVRIEVGNAVRVVCQRLLVADRTGWTGPQARFGAEMPSPDAVPARALDATTWQCGACAEPFDVEPDAAFTFCPMCRRLAAAPR